MPLTPQELAIVRQLAEPLDRGQKGSFVNAVAQKLEAAGPGRRQAHPSCGARGATIVLHAAVRSSVGAGSGTSGLGGLNKSCTDDYRRA